MVGRLLHVLIFAIAINRAAESPIRADPPAVPAPLSTTLKLADGFRFTEGPAYDNRGGWYFSDIPNKTLHHWSEDRGSLTIRTGEQASNGIVVAQNGDLIFCEVGGRRIVHRTLSGDERTLSDSCDGWPLGMPNDLWIAPDGAIYFTVPKTNRRRAKVVPANAVNATVCRISPDGKATTNVGLGLKSCNGIVGTADGKTLFVADPGSQTCWRYDIRPDGSLANQSVAAKAGSDGLAVDQLGHLYTTGREGVDVWSSDGEKVSTIPVPERPANMKFGGPDNKTLFVTARAGIYSVEMNVAGG